MFLIIALWAAALLTIAAVAATFVFAARSQAAEPTRATPAAQLPATEPATPIVVVWV
ncbi:MAG TPA: hypothetical protein VFS21_15950 [Roseiflexaceae bacterium]|nr:hypothetical protein [Roseiflexaceae bacterium]